MSTNLMERSKDSLVFMLIGLGCIAIGYYAYIYNYKFICLFFLLYSLWCFVGVFLIFFGKLTERGEK